MAQEKKTNMETLRIKELCKERGVTMQSVADGIGISRTSLTGISNGRYKPAYTTILKLAEHFNIPARELFPGQDFIAMVSTNGKTRRFDTPHSLREYLDHLEKGE